MNAFSSLFTAKTGDINLTGFLAEAAAELEKENKAKLVKETVSILRDVQSTKDSLVQNLRGIRKQEKQYKKNVEEFTLAVQYFAETGNFGPLAKFMYRQVDRCCRGLGVRFPNGEEQKIPEGWKPKEELVMNQE